ncbi:hypothetical protein WMZ97_01955 [Lentibacillus sp. N15]|uniref:hypothetical protein n=1 Tax=Lentibacillus songyuanensis TaxID=3136161 RepID=UPI0031B9D7E2
MAKKWGVGGFIILLATILYIISLFLPWIDLYFIKMNGFQREGYLVLLLFIYPVYSVLARKSLNRIAGVAVSVIAIGVLISFLTTLPVEVMGQSVQAVGAGLYIGLAASVILGIGTVIKVMGK